MNTITNEASHSLQKAPKRRFNYSLRSSKRLFMAVLFTMVCLHQAWAYNFSVVVPSGQTLYFNINSNNPNSVSVTYPGSSYPYYNGYTKPTGNLVIPESITFYGTTYSVTSIGYCAFEDCNGLTSVTIPNSVTSIGGHPFINCSSLTTLNFNAINCSDFNSSLPPFYGCPISTIVIGDSVQHIPAYFAYNNSSLTSVTIPNSVTAIGNDAFSGCSGLTSVTIPNSVTSIGNYAFDDCSGLTSVNIPNSVTAIGNGAFSGCSSLTSVTIPNSVTSIGSEAFSGCSGLTSVNIPNSVTTIKEYAFYNCTRLTSVNIPNSITSIENYAFGLVKNIIYSGRATGRPWGALNVDGYIDGDFIYSNSTKTTLTAYIGSSSNVTIPNSVTSIEKYAFRSCSSLTSVTIHNSITSIERGAFSCSGLTSVTIPNSVTSIKQDAFKDCNGLTSVTIPNSITSIESGAFSGCSGLTSVTIPNSVTSIGGEAFSGCSGLTSVTIPNSVRSIGCEAFSGCSNLTTLNFNAFNCSDFTSSCHPFTDCPISTIIIGASVQRIPGCFAYDNRSLTSLTIGYLVNSIGSHAFYGCSGLTTLNFNAVNCSYNAYPFYDCPISTIIIGDNVQHIPARFAYNKYSLTSVTIPNSVTSIGNYAFSGCSGLTSVTIGNSVTSIGGHAFEYCTGLDIIRCKSITPPTADHVWNSVPTNTNVYVPCGCSSVYSANTSWSRFTNIQDTSYINVELLVNDSLMGHAEVLLNSCDSTIIEATPNREYIFLNWSDGNTNNPRIITLTRDTTFIAYFTLSYTLTTISANDRMGTVSGGGEYAFGSEVTITATAAEGYHFVNWSDGDTNNSRVITLTQDTVFTAYFANNIYSITVESSDTVCGSAVGDTTTEYLNVITISATANYGYHFSRWNDGNTNNPRSITVTQNMNFTAIFDKNNYNIALSADSDIHGYMSGIGNYEYLDSCNIAAIANYGYHFIHWNDGDTNNPRVITLIQDTAFTAYFAKNTYTLLVQSNDTTLGVVSGSTVCEYLDTISISATTTIPHYHFVQWSDGNTDATRNVVITTDSIITAIFAIDTHSVTLVTNNDSYGSVNGICNVAYGTTVTIEAIAAENCHFVSWNDGNTNNLRTITLTSDTTFVAYFALNNYTVTVISANDSMGTVSGGGEYAFGSEVTITATASENHHFVSWNDGNTDNPRTITVTRDAVYIASFAEDVQVTTYTITVMSANNNMGSVMGGGTYEEGTQATITATPAENHHFVSWNDGNTDNPRTITVTGDATYIASFAEDVSIDAANELDALTFYPNPTSGTITFNCTDIRKVEVMDAMGRMVAEYIDSYVIDLSKLSKGHYTMRITTDNGVTIRKVIRN